MDYASCLEVHRLWKGDLLMIKGFLLAFNVILFALFLIGMIFGLKTKETEICYNIKRTTKEQQRNIKSTQTRKKE